MKNQLSDTWLTDKHIELEYKSYLVLAYLQEAENDFENLKVYPALADLIQKYKEMTFLKSNAELENYFAKKISGINLKNQKIEYQFTERDLSVFEEVLNVINFSLPLFEEQIQLGKNKFDYIEKQLNIRSVGILPLRKTEGYFLLPDFFKKATKVYEYSIGVYTSSEENYKAIRTEYISDYSWNFVNTYESIKLDLIKNQKKFPVPAVYVAETDREIPFEESCLPIAKRLLVQKISSDEV